MFQVKAIKHHKSLPSCTQQTLNALSISGYRKFGSFFFFSLTSSSGRNTNLKAKLDRNEGQRDNVAALRQHDSSLVL